MIIIIINIITINNNNKILIIIIINQNKTQTFNIEENKPFTLHKNKFYNY